jgi:hypothetical protein
MVHARMRSLFRPAAAHLPNTSYLLFSSSTPQPPSQRLCPTTNLATTNSHHKNKQNDRLNTLPPHKPPNRPNSNLPNRLFNPLPLLHRRRRLDPRLPPTLSSPHNPRLNRHLHHPRKQHSLVLHRRPQRHHPGQHCLGAEEKCYGVEVWLQYLVHAQ